jgi:glycosyltransferase involved in cell wall biosynthesis
MLEGGKIRLLTVIGSSNFGGAERNVVSHLSALDPSRYEIFVACHGHGPMLDEYRRVAAAVRSYDLLRVWRPTTIPALAAWMRSVHCDVVHTHLWTADFLGGLAAIQARVPARVTSVRGHYFLHVGVTGGRRWRRQIMSRSYRAVYHLFHRVIAVAPSVAADLVTRPGVRVRRGDVSIVPNGVDIEEVRRSAVRTTPALPVGRPLIVAVANLFAIKGHLVLLNAMRNLPKKYPGAQLLLVGEGPNRVPIEQLIARLGLISHVTLVGARDDAAALCAAADLVVLASLSEGTPRALLEALALERPVVATAVGGIPDLIVDGVTGRLVAPADVLALGNAMDDLLSDPPRAQAMGRNGRLHVAGHFSARRAAWQTQEIYEELLTGGPAV